MSNIGARMAMALTVVGFIAATVSFVAMSDKSLSRKALAQECREVLGVELVTEGTSPGVAGAQRRIALRRLLQMEEQAYDSRALDRVYELYDSCLSGGQPVWITIKP